MGNKHQTEEDHTPRRKVHVGRRVSAPDVFKDYRTLSRFLHAAGFRTLPGYPAVQRIAAGLARFRSNVTRFYAERKEDRLVLRQHLAFTLLVPGGKADRARTAVDELTAQGILGAHASLMDEAAIAELIKPNVRFHNQKAFRLVRNMSTWDGYLRERLRDMRGTRARAYLRKHTTGFGPKAAAHFLRNVGLSSNLPIIDVHIRKVLAEFHFKGKSYTAAEQSFKALAKLVGLDVHFLDACLWCAYANNWIPNQADFDNFGAEVYTSNQKE